MALNKSYIMTLVPDGQGNISIPGANKMSQEGPEIWIGYGPWILAPPGYPTKYIREVFAVAILHDIALNEWVVVADGDDPSVWATIDPMNTGVKPKDMGLDYRYWAVDWEYDDAQSKKIKGKSYTSYEKGSVPDWDLPQTINVNDPELGTVAADVTKAKPSTHKNIAGFTLPEDVEADNQVVKK
ncbi:MAG: hypothetical protein ACWGQW_02160 [bacterium]